MGKLRNKLRLERDEKVSAEKLEELVSLREKQLSEKKQKVGLI